MVATVHIVQASVEVGSPGARQIAFEDASVAIAWRLVFLIDVEHLAGAHLVAWKEGDWLLDITRIVPFLHGFDKLIVGGYHIDGHISYVYIIEVTE